MKNYFLSIFVLALLVMVGCKDASTEAETKETTEVEEVEMEAPDYAAFDKKVAVIRAFIDAHSKEDLDTQKALLSDSLQWSPPMYTDGAMWGKAEYVAALEGYHNDYEDIRFTEGIVTADSIVGGFWSGSVFPESTATIKPDAIRVYGTWRAIHTESGKDIGVKWFGITWVDDEGLITAMNEYWDVHGLKAQIEAE